VTGAIGLPGLILPPPGLPEPIGLTGPIVGLIGLTGITG